MTTMNTTTRPRPIAAIRIDRAPDTLTAREMARTPHELDGTLTRATVGGERYTWNKRRGMWMRSFDLN